MDIGIILSVVSLIFPLIATIINAKGPKKYKNIYVNFLFFTVGLSLGIIIICASLKVSNIINSEKVSISINKCENDLSTKVSNLNYGDYKSILPVMYSCTITNLGEKPVTCVNYDILSNIDVKNRPYSPGMGFLDGETKIVKPFDLNPSFVPSSMLVRSIFG